MKERQAERLHPLHIGRGLGVGGCSLFRFLRQEMKNNILIKICVFYAFYLVLSNKFATFAPEIWNRFPLVPHIFIYKRMLNLS